MVQKSRKLDLGARSFGDKKYEFSGSFNGKIEANKYAKKMRKWGNYVRVTEGTPAFGVHRKRWNVYVRKK